MQDATFLFTDIEGSTRLWEEQPERMRPALARHDALAREAVEASNGRVVKMTGDGVHAVFGDALDAVMATLKILSSVATVAPDIELRVRCGLHAGPAEGRDGDYFGTVVNRAARVMSAAHGGQALLSDAVVQRLDGRLPEGAALRDLGAVRLRDLARPERIYQIVHPALREDFPALRSLEGTPNNLPVEMSSFVGREREIEAVRGLMAQQRLVSVVGLGGLGKTRLALHAAAESLEAYPDGTWLVELAPVQEARWVAQAIALALGVKEDTGRPIEEALLRHVRDRSMLIVLDNCEHVLEGAAAMARKLLSAGPALRILATSREPLRIPGERLWPLGGLAVPGPREALSREAVAPYESVRLFVERAAAASPAFELDIGNSASIAAICHRLDGIPLAIELAAARVRSVPLDEIAARLKDRFRLLTSADPTATPRQKTLRATIDWSHELLPDAERALFRQLSVFAGGWTIEAAEAVCGESHGAVDVLDGLSRLVEKSLVGLRERPARYEMLETVREYAAQQLASSGEGDDVRRRHLQYFAQLAQRAKIGLAGREQGAWLARLDVERENVFAAHASAGVLPGCADLGLLLVNGTKFYWVFRGLLQLGSDITAEALRRDGASPKLRAQAQFHGGQLAYCMGDYATARVLLEASLAGARRSGDSRGIGAVLQSLGVTAIALGDYAAGHACLGEAVEACRVLGEDGPLGSALTAMALLMRAEGNAGAARDLYQRGLDLLSRVGDHESCARTLANLAMLAIEDGDAGRAHQLAGESLRQAALADSAPATQAVVELCAALACQAGDSAACARFMAAAEAMARKTGVRRDPVDDAFLQRGITAARREMGEAAFAAAVRSAPDLVEGDARRAAAAWLEARDGAPRLHQSLITTGS